MIPDPPHHIAHLGVHLGQKCGRRRVEMTGKHEVLPHHQPQLVAQIVKPVRLVPPAAPDPDHVHMRIDRRLQQPPHSIARDPSVQRIRRDPVRPLGKHIPPVDPEPERPPRRIRLADQRQRTQPDPPHGNLIAHRHDQIMQNLRAMPRRPPQLRLLHPQHQRRTATNHRGRHRHPADTGRNLCSPCLHDNRDVNPPCPMHLTDHDIANPGPPSLQPHGRNPELPKRDVPVPPEVALLFAQHVGKGNRPVNLLIRNVKRHPRLPRR